MGKCEEMLLQVPLRSCFGTYFSLRLIWILKLGLHLIRLPERFKGRFSFVLPTDNEG
jgi:hypothetical protein